MMTFKEYLKQSRYYKQDSVRGDLAYDIVRDKQLCDDASIDETSDYLEAKLSEEDWKEFLALRRAYQRAQSSK